MSGLIITSSTPRSPQIISENEYKEIETLFSQGLSRDKVIENLNYDRSWYYRKLKTDIALKRAEAAGYDTFVENLPKSIAVGLNKTLVGHKEVKIKQRYEFQNVVDEATGLTTRERVLVEEVVEEVYVPPNASVVNAVARTMIAGLKPDDAGINEVDEKFQQMSDEDIKALAEIASKQLKDMR